MLVLNGTINLLGFAGHRVVSVPMMAIWLRGRVWLIWKVSVNMGACVLLEDLGELKVTLSDRGAVWRDATAGALAIVSAERPKGQVADLLLLRPGDQLLGVLRQELLSIEIAANHGCDAQHGVQFGT